LVHAYTYSFYNGNLKKVFSYRTSAKIGLYNSSSRHQPPDDEPNNDEQTTEELAGDETAKDKDDKPEVDPHVKSLIQSVAFEIQKSFSQRNLRKVQYKNTENLNLMYT
jgi:hypothetical protein